MKLIRPLRSRFIELQLEPYTWEEFKEIIVKLLAKRYSTMSDVAKIYYTKTNNALSKVCLGEYIANLIKEKSSPQKSVPEKLVQKIHDKVSQQMNLEYK